MRFLEIDPRQHQPQFELYNRYGITNGGKSAGSGERVGLALCCGRGRRRDCDPWKIDAEFQCTFGGKRLAITITVTIEVYGLDLMTLNSVN